jgi:hypothetical protein
MRRAQSRSPGKRRCRFHGGLSTGPKTAAEFFGGQMARGALLRAGNRPVAVGH